MAKITIHTFLFGPFPPEYPNQIDISVYLNDDSYVTAEAIDTFTGLPVTVPLDVTEDELGFAFGDTMYWKCLDGTTTRLDVKAKVKKPFGYIQLTENSPSCGYVPPGSGSGPCSVIASTITHTDETALGLHDGTITADVAFTDTTSTKEYSLDGTTWQASGEFIGLYPGDYQLRVRRTGTTCYYNTWITIAAGPAPDPEPPYPWQDKPCLFFKLIRGGVEYPIREPIKWDQVNIVGKRDKDYHGWLYQYSDGIIELEWDCYSGLDVIEAEYAAKGSDGEVFFQYGYTYKGNSYVLLDSKLNLNTRKRYPAKVSATIERSDMNLLFTSRIDTKVKMTDTLSVGDVPVAPPAQYQTTLHAKEIVRNFSFIQAEAIQGYFDFAVGPTHPIWVFPATSDAQLDEISKSYQKDFSYVEEDPVPLDLYTWDIEFDGTYDLHVEFDIRLVFDFINDVYPLPIFTASMVFNVNGTENLLGLPQNVITDPDNKVLVFHIFGERTGIPLKKGDKVFLYLKLTAILDVTVSSTLNWFQENTNITFTSLEKSEDTTASGWFIHEVADQCIRVITDNKSELRSKLLDRIGYRFPTDGEAALNWVTNGKQIRNFNVADNPLTISLKDILTSLKAIYCIGFGFEKYGAKEVVRIERVGYFYQNKQILVVEECEDYREEVAKEYLYNDIEIGYEKYQDSGYNTNDEFNTKHELISPIQTNKQKLTAKSLLITSGYKIEDVRRQQFAETGKDSYSNDDDGFMISMRRVDGENFLPEKNEAFVTVSNLISPGTAYNLRLSPLRMLLNWADWLRNCFHYKQPTDKIKTTSVAQNSKLITQLKADDPRPVGDILKAEWNEGQDITMADYNVTERIFRPEFIYFKCRMTPDKVNMINRALMGRESDSINYGYITVKDPNGDYQGGFPFEMEYNFWTEQLTVKMLKKWDSPVDPAAECCKYLMVNGCKLKVNGNYIIVK